MNHNLTNSDCFSRAFVVSGLNMAHLAHRFLEIFVLMSDCFVRDTGEEKSGWSAH